MHWSSPSPVQTWRTALVPAMTDGLLSALPIFNHHSVIKGLPSHLCHPVRHPEEPKEGAQGSTRAAHQRHTRHASAREVAR